MDEKMSQNELRSEFAPDCPLTSEEKEHLFHLNAEKIYGI